MLIAPSKVLTVTVGRLWSYPILFMLRAVCRIDCEIKGRQHLPKTPCIIAAKHQSAWETLAFYKIILLPCFVLKKELLKIPLYGKYLERMDSIVVNRMAGASALKKMVADTKARLEKGRTVIIFPEGTRVKAGATGEYHPGVSALYSRCDVPVVPVALNSGLYWAKNSFIKKPGKIILEFLPPIQPGLRRDQFMEILQKQIEEKTREITEGK